MAKLKKRTPRTPGKPRGATAGPAAAKRAAAKRAVAKPVAAAAKGVAAKGAAAKGVAAKPGAKPVAAKRAAAKPDAKPGAAKGAAAKGAAAKRAAAKPVTAKPVAAKRAGAAAKPVAAKGVAAKGAAAKPDAKGVAAKPGAKPVAAKGVAAKGVAATPSAARQAARPSRRPAIADPVEPAEPAAPTRTRQIADAASARADAAALELEEQATTGAASEPARPVRLGSITAPSGTVAVFDVGLMGYLPREVIDPMLICAPVPADRPLAVVAVRVGAGRFAERWDHVAIELVEPAADGARPAIARSRKLGEAAVDFARLLCIDRAALDHWRHEDSLDQLADFVFWGRDADALAKALGARRLPGSDGLGWTDLPIAEAEAKADRAAALKAEHKWLLVSELRPHSHHHDALAAARASPSGAGVIDLAGSRALLVFTSWGNGVFPVYLDSGDDGQPARIRIQLAASSPPPAGIAAPAPW